VIAARGTGQPSTANIAQNGLDLQENRIQVLLARRLLVFCFNLRESTVRFLLLRFITLGQVNAPELLQERHNFMLMNRLLQEE
jgi:hypothetical protein